MVNNVVDLDLVREWSQICEGHHKGACEIVWRRDRDERLPKTVRMVDVDALSIVPVPPSCCKLHCRTSGEVAVRNTQSMQANIAYRMTPAG